MSVFVSHSHSTKSRPYISIIYSVYSASAPCRYRLQYRHCGWMFSSRSLCFLCPLGTKCPPSKSFQCSTFPHVMHSALPKGSAALSLTNRCSSRAASSLSELIVLCLGIDTFFLCRSPSQSDHTEGKSNHVSDRSFSERRAASCPPDTSCICR